jgi:glycosyltransferase involved in cell wall biosynthesis
MRIIFVTPYFYPAWQYGGTPRAAYELARALARRGHSVTVLTTDSAGAARLETNNASPSPQSIDGINVYYYPNLSNRLAYDQRIFLPVRFFKDLRRHLDNCDVVHIHEFRSLLTVAVARMARRLGLPYIVSPHGALKHLGKEQIKVVFDRLWGNRILKDAAAITVVSEIERNEALNLGIARRIELLPNPIVVEEYATMPSRGGFRAKYRISDPIILFLGRLHWVKGADLLVQAVATLNRHRNVHLILAGPDDGQRSTLARLVQQERLEDRVTFAGFITGKDKLEALVDADVVAVPSRSEVFSITTVESLLCGTPVVLSSACGLTEDLNERHGVTRFISEDVNNLAAALTSVLENQRRPNVADAREFIAREFSPDSVAGLAEALYADCSLWHDRRPGAKAHGP